MLKYKYLPEYLKLKSGMKIPRLIPAPMEGIMGPLFCVTASNLKLFDIWITPFIRISTHVPGIKRLEAKIRFFKESGLPFIVQLAGNCPVKLAAAAARLEDAGAVGINMNFACPSKSVVRNGAGGSLLKKPDLMKEIMLALKEKCPGLSISAKIRSGFSDHREIEKIIPAFDSETTDFIICHFRTVTEAYRPVKNGFRRLKRAVEISENIPVFGSGDLFSPESAVEMIEVSGCAGIAFARGLLEDPMMIRRLEKKISGGDCKTGMDDAKKLFFLEMIRNASEKPELFLRKAAFMEIARCFWGSDSEIFGKLRKISEKDILLFGKEDF